MKHFLLLLHGLVLGLSTLLAPVRAAAQVLPGTFATGNGYSLSIHADGTLWATGDNSLGQLGLPTSTASTSSWVQVGTATNWVMVAAGGYHGLGLRADGTLWGWGSNYYGQLGATNNGAITATPTRVGTALYTQVSAGGYHSLGLRVDGTLWAWGLNTDGQLGNATNVGTDAATPTPTRVGTGLYTQVVAGRTYSLGLRADGTLWAWGNNEFGQLGTATNAGTDAATPTPTRVGTDLYTQVAAGGSHSLGLRADGTLWAWGANQFGQLGGATNLGTDNATPTPMRVGTDLYKQVAAGGAHSLGLRADGTLWAWGLNTYGQLGTTASLGTTTPNPTPTQVGTGHYVQMVGSNHNLALRADGTLWAWGAGYRGQLGNARTNDADATPTATGTALPTRSIAASGSAGLAVRADGTLWAWGYNGYGQLGNGTTLDSRRPQQVGTDRDWVQVAAGSYFFLALKADGTLWGWGSNADGQLNQTSPTINPTPLRVGVATDRYLRVAAGAFHSLALRADGTLWAWGYNQFGQLGNPTNVGNSTPTPPTQAGTALYTQLTAGASHTLALRADGTLWAWGNHSNGQLGVGSSLGNYTYSATPRQVSGLYTRVAAGNSHNQALRADGTRWAWGYNSAGQLGTGTSTSSAITSPTQAGTDLYTQVATGFSHGLGLRTDGSLWAWGHNASGQLGRGTRNGGNPIPAREASGQTWATLATGAMGDHSLVRPASGLAFASAGYNQNGQLGDGTVAEASRFDRLSPLASLQPLPVQLVAFAARRSAPATVALSWTTATEVDNASFMVEKSADGAAWQRLAFVPGAGSSATARAYSYLDTDGTAAAYYRLAQADGGGLLTYSPVQYVGGSSGAPSLYPNPASGPATLRGAAPGARVLVLDALGRPVRTTAADASGSAQLGGLAPGFYLVRSGSHTLRLVVE